MTEVLDRVLTKADLQAAMRARKVSEARYWETIKAAREEGWSNSEIARAVGVSEAAIRLYYRRRAAEVITSVKTTRTSI